MIQFQPDLPILHAYILSAADAAVREEDTTALAAAMLCTDPGIRPCGQCRDCRKVFRGVHPDVIYVEPAPGGKTPMVKVDQIREIISGAHIMPTEAQRKVYVIRRADTMNASAQNALLKLLEEPPRSASFLLAAERAEALLPTVRSRCELIRRNAEAEAPPEDLAREAERFLRALSGGSRTEPLRWCQAHEKDESESLRQLLTAILRRTAAHLTGEAAVPDLPEADALALTARLERCLEFLRAGVSVKHTLGLLSLPVHFDQN